MSLVTELTPRDAERMQLNSGRYTATVLSNLAIFGLLALAMQLTESSMSSQVSVGLMAVGVGVMMSILFVWGTPEPDHPRKKNNCTQLSSLLFLFCLVFLLYLLLFFFIFYFV